ncbi:MAG: HIT family protein [Candidatus ainarchaeum sp.]|nr:HIT family protein [Candidatus ainarchaeum sp.]
MENCLFCKFVKGEIPCAKVYESDKAIAFLDINPINPGHILVILKKHVDYIFDLEDKDYKELFLEAKKVAKAIKFALGPKRVGVAVEGFGVPHAHIHLVPINRGYELNPNNAKPMDNKELEKIAEKIRKGFGK